MNARTPRTRLIFLALIAIWMVSCGERPEPVVPPGDDPVAVRQHDGSLWIRWQHAPAGRVSVYVDEDPDAISRASAIGDLKDGELLVTGLPGDRRPYFALVPDEGSSLIVAERLLPLEGAHNFRDLGGYATADGRRVKWGRVYRSDHLGDLTEADLRYLEQLGIRTVCDFRSAFERESSPDRLGEAGTPRTVNPSISDERFAMDELQDRILSGDLGEIDFAELLVDGNRAFARDYTAEYSEFLGLVERPEDLPLVFHCTAGKDRAGFAAVVLLSALGVPEEVVINDYLLTQPYTQKHIEDTLLVIRFASLFRTDVERLRPLLGVRLDYIRAAIDTVDEHYGSMDGYLENALGLTPERRAALQDLLLE
jgi:protein-tyrosine phosphatase